MIWFKRDHVGTFEFSKFKIAQTITNKKIINTLEAGVRAAQRLEKEIEKLEERVVWLEKDRYD